MKKLTAFAFTFALAFGLATTQAAYALEIPEIPGVEIPHQPEIPEVDPDAPTIVCDVFTTLEEQGAADFDVENCGSNESNDDTDGGSGSDGDDSNNDDTSGGDDTANDDESGNGDGSDDSSDDTSDDNSDGGSSNTGSGGGTSGGNGGGSGNGNPVVEEATSTSSTVAELEVTIFNEAATSIGEGVYEITWETDIPTTGWVAYSTLSTPDASLEDGAPGFGYPNASSESGEATTTHSTVLNIPASITTLYFRPVAHADDAYKLGTELSVTPQIFNDEGEVEDCDQYLHSFVKFGGDNNTQQVTRLQNFLREFEGFDVETTGEYGQTTLQAVRDFQNRYSGEILSPWGIAQPSGYVYLTTRKKINELYCEGVGEFPLTAEQLAEIENFKQLVTAPATRTEDIDTTTVGAATPSDDTGVVTADTDESEDDASAQLAGAAAAVDDTPGFFGRLGGFFKRLFGSREE